MNNRNKFLDIIGYDINNAGGIDEFIKDLESLILKNKQDINQRNYYLSREYFGTKVSKKDDVTVTYKCGPGVLIPMGIVTGLKNTPKRAENVLAGAAVKVLSLRKKRIGR